MAIPDAERRPHAASTPPAARPRAEVAATAAMMADVKLHGAVGAALRALFLPGGDALRFGALMRESVESREGILVAAAAQARLRLQDNAYELLSARDLLADSSATLGDASAAASAALTEVSAASERLKHIVAARKALDATLEIVARTRTLVRIYARAEDMAAGRRLHGALRTLGRLDEAAAAARDDDVLRELLPPSEPLRADMVAHVRRALLAWLNAVRADMPAIGSFVLSFVRQRARAAHAGGSGDAVRAVGPVWIPTVYDDERGYGAGGPASSLRLQRGLQSGAGVSASSRQFVDVRQPGSRASELGVGDVEIDDVDRSNRSPPRVSMRLLLTCVLTCRDLGRLDGFGDDYRRERAKQLESGIGAILQEKSNANGNPLSSADRYARLVNFIVSFFTVERAVATYSSTALVPPALLTGLWDSAFEIATSTAAEISEESDADEVRRVRALANVLRYYARMYEFERSI
jgi:hypothetical protein